MGVIAGVVYLIAMFLFIPFRYAELASVDRQLAMEKVREYPFCHFTLSFTSYKRSHLSLCARFFPFVA